MRSSSALGALVIALALALGGCASASKLLHRSAPPPRPRTPAGLSYLERLRGAETSLAEAERVLPRRPRTPAQLAHATSLLAAAVGRLATALQAVAPPRVVARLHRRLVGIARGYHERLVRLARRTRDPAGEVAAADAMLHDTASASAAFTATYDAIRARLAR